MSIDGCRSELDGHSVGTAADPAIATMASGFRLALTVVGAAEDAGVLTLRWLEDAALRCARLGVPIDEVHTMVNEGFESGLSEQVGSDDGSTTLWLHDLLHRTVTRAYQRV
ncbi:hypothetical protein ACWDSJ_11015 [Nocardia sp. NPDC003482]